MEKLNEIEWKPFCYFYLLWVQICTVCAFISVIELPRIPAYYPKIFLHFNHLHYMNIHIQYYRNMHNKIHSVISPLFRIKNADTETGRNVQILRSVWIISAEIRYLLSEQKKFQNKSKNIDEVYQSVFFRCIMFLSYRVTFLCNVLGQIHYTSESPVRYFFMKKL